MGLLIHPRPGTIVRVDLNDGFRPPEMIKRRPAIVLSPEIAGRDLCTIVPMSTSDPRVEMAHHLRLTLDPPLPAPYDSPTMWVKGDMVITVGFHRLRLLFSHKERDGQRVYDARRLDDLTFSKVQDCVRSALGLMP